MKIPENVFTNIGFEIIVVSFIADENIPESSQVKLSKYCVLRPQNVKLMSQASRKLCFCIYHSNFIQCYDALHKYNLNIAEYGPELIELLVCDNQTRQCYFKTCKHYLLSSTTNSFVNQTVGKQILKQSVGCNG